MPLVFFDVIKGRDKEALKKLLDTTHNVFLEALEIPVGDRYQIVREHDTNEMIIEDTGLGFKRTKDIVVLTVISRQREEVKKQLLYRRLSEELEKECQLKPEDLMISMVVNDAADWSFGFGRGQFMTGEL